MKNISNIWALHLFSVHQKIWTKNEPEIVKFGPAFSEGGLGPNMLKGCTVHSWQFERLDLLPAGQNNMLIDIFFAPATIQFLRWIYATYRADSRHLRLDSAVFRKILAFRGSKRHLIGPTS